jgi:hypothetical protein
MKIIKRFGFAIILVFVSGCETIDAYSLTDTLNSWIYSDINNYIDANGYPNSSVELPNGNKVYTFTSYSGNRQWWCHTELEVNESTIVSWSWEGNSCE